LHTAHRRNGGELTTCNTVSRTSVVAGRTKLPWRRRERHPVGSTAEGHPHFFREPQGLPGPPQPAIRLHLMRDLVSCPLARPRRERAGLLACRHFQRSRIRCSWRLGPVRFRQASSQTNDGMSMGAPRKNLPWPLAASAPSAQPDVPRPMSNPKREKRSTGFGNAAERRLNRAGAPAPGSPATRSTKTLFTRVGMTSRRDGECPLPVTRSPGTAARLEQMFRIQTVAVGPFARSSSPGSAWA
jgi:hypothetical protein